MIRLSMLIVMDVFRFVLSRVRQAITMLDLSDSAILA